MTEQIEYKFRRTVKVEGPALVMIVLLLGAILGVLFMMAIK